MHKPQPAQVFPCCTALHRYPSSQAVGFLSCSGCTMSPHSPKDGGRKSLEPLAAAAVRVVVGEGSDSWERDWGMQIKPLRAMNWTTLIYTAAWQD